MRLTSFTDYSLRVLIYLAVSGEEQVTIREIAQRYSISRNHLMKVVHELSQKGYLNASRGKNGGLRLKVSPAEINIGALVREMENDFALAECLGDSNHCILTPTCKLRSVLHEALDAFFEILDAYTLEDILAGRRRAELVRLLDIG